MRIKGLESPGGTDARLIGFVDLPATILIRPNARALASLLDSPWRDVRLAAATALLKAEPDDATASEVWTSTMLEKPFDWSTLNGMNLAARLPAGARAPLLPVIQRLAQLKTRDSLSPTRYTVSDAERISGKIVKDDE